MQKIVDEPQEKFCERFFETPYRNYRRNLWRNSTGILGEITKGISEGILLNF